VTIRTRKYSGNDIANIALGLIVLLVGLTQISRYFSGINPPQNSTAVSVPANSTLGVIQLVATIATALIILGLSTFSSKWLRNVATIILIAILILEFGMAMGYSGL
jgi:hypothetical protein